MLKYTGNFLVAINDNVREVGIKITYTHNDIKCLIQGDEVMEVTYTSQGKKEMGCVVLKVVDATLRLNDNTKQLQEGMFIDLTYICDGECQTDIFYINYLKPKNNTLTVQAVDLLTYLADTVSPKMPLNKDVYLKDYMANICSSLKLPLEVDADIVNPKLTLAYPKSTSILETFRELSVACNGIINFGLTQRLGAYLPFYLPVLLENRLIGASIKRFAGGAPQATINQYIKYSIVKDSSNKYDDVKVCMFFPTQGEQTEIGTLKALIPASTTNYSLGTVNFSNTCIPQVLKFNDRVQVDKYTLGSTSCGLTMSNTGTTDQAIECTFYGLNIENAATLEDEADSNNIKTIKNMYIQSIATYNTDIYKNDDIEISYFGNPCIEVGDTISIDGMTVLVVEHILKYTGGLRGTIKGVIV